MLRTDLNIFMDAIRLDLRYGLTADAWSAGVYAVGDHVVHNGVTYRCIQITINEEPVVDPTYWVTVPVKRPRGKVYIDSADLVLYKAEGQLVGTAFSLPVYRKAALANGKYQYYDEAGLLLASN